MGRLRRAYAAELKLYRAHHANRSNWRLHCACVPLEWLACLVALAELPRVGWLRPHWLVQLGLGAYVLPLGLPTTAVLAAAQLGLAAAADAVHVSLPSADARLVAALVAYACSWLLQVPVGHWLLERNQPAMATKLTLNSVVLSVALAWDWGEVRDRVE